MKMGSRPSNVRSVGQFKSMIGAKQHLTKKHRARSEDDEDEENYYSLDSINA